VVVEGVAMVASLVAPAGLFDGDDPRLLADRVKTIDDDTLRALRRVGVAGITVELRPGIPDLADLAAFTIPVAVGDYTTDVQGRLNDDDTVSLRLPNPEEFVTRAQAATRASQR
jgi:hypothetical protein